MKIIFFLFLVFSLNASDILTKYRLEGMSTIEKQLDLDLTDKQYWDKQVQNIDTTFGYLESYTSVLSCDKNNSTLSLFKLDVDNVYTQVKTYNAFTGKVSGDKKIEGDLITPLGVYNIIQRLDKDNQLDPFYGPLAFVTTYPNIYDKSKGKNGSGIWIHGLPINQKRDDFTRGCIAIDNQSIECLDRNIDISKTILIINQNATKIDISKENLSSILSSLYKWRYAWKYNEIDNYLTFYAQDFKKTNGTNLANFEIIKTFIFSKKEKKIIIFKDINILKYPNLENTYQISFNEYYKTKYVKFTGNKTIMIRLDKEKNMKIFLEN